MSYSISHFQTVQELYPTWPALEAALAEQGIRVVKTETPGIVVIRTTPTTKAEGPFQVDLFRSVIWNTEAGRPLCVAPFKGRTTPVPFGTNLSSVEECIDGMMVNVFVEADQSKSLQLATRTQLGAKNRFYSEKSFDELFVECLATTQLIGKAGLEAALRTWMEGAEGATSCFASFVLQHPEHRIVAKVSAPRLFCVQVGYCMEDGSVQLYEKATTWPEAFGSLQPRIYPFQRFETPEFLQLTLQSTAAERGWRWAGWMIKDGQGGRWAVRAPNYTELRGLRGAEATPMERFIRLRKAHTVRDYLKHYAEDRDAFNELEGTLRSRTQDVYKFYTQIHKVHAIQFKEAPEAYRPAVFRLHVAYMKEKRPVTFKQVIQVVSELADYEMKRLLQANPYEVEMAVDTVNGVPITEDH